MKHDRALRDAENLRDFPRRLAAPRPLQRFALARGQIARALPSEPAIEQLVHRRVHEAREQLRQAQQPQYVARVVLERIVGRHAEHADRAAAIVNGATEPVDEAVRFRLVAHELRAAGRIEVVVPDERHGPAPAMLNDGIDRQVVGGVVAQPPLGRKSVEHAAARRRAGDLMPVREILEAQLANVVRRLLKEALLASRVQNFVKRTNGQAFEHRTAQLK
ncbi:autoinducer-binding transcriptional regulator, LuxR family domain protein [Burkholderia pseudomallei]|nr:autoinducer-binding transcriptional regulator, LuxR family domain protein [Burkholderia pseudomallei]